MRPSLLAFTALLPLAACGGEDPDPAPGRPPDVVLLTVDTLRADRLSCYGYERETTPFLDRLAAQGTRFDDVTSQFSWTVPSMISIFTGQYLTTKRVEVHPDERTLAQAFQRAGYETIGVVANVLLQRDTGLGRGFQHFVAPEVEEFAEAEWSVDDLMQRALPLLAEVVQHEDRPPVLLYLHAMEPHDPYVAHVPDAEELFPDPEADLQPGGWHAQRLAELGLADEAPRLLRRARKLRRRYDGELRALDRDVERAFDRLRELGLLDHAVFALFADHGEGLFDHASPPDTVAGALSGEARDTLRVFYQKHGAIVYQEVVRTPLVLWGAGVPAGLVIEDAVENVDLFPTLLQLVDLPARRKVDGRSLVPLLTGERESSREHVYSLGVRVSSVREVSTGLKLVVRDDTPELYDLGADPAERDDLASARPADVKRLADALRAWAAANPAPEGAKSTGASLDARLEAIGYADDDVGVDD